MSDSIPVIDFAGMLEDSADLRMQVAQEVDRCARKVGFMYLKNFGIAPETIEAAKSTARRFFAQSLEAKEQYAYNQELNFGYHGIGKEALDPTKPKDLKETFTMRNAPALKDPSAWPSTLYQQVSVDFFNDCHRLADRLMSAFALALELPPDHFSDKHTGLTQTLRLLHYPPSESAAEGQMGAGAHTDYGSTTFVFQDASGGLEVMNQAGEWVAAPPIEGTIVVNTGDLLARWTNDLYRSTPHRVKVRPAAAAAGRLSIAFFNDPDPEVLVETLPSCMSAENPSKYPPITAHAHILERIAASNKG